MFSSFTEGINSLYVSLEFSFAVYTVFSLWATSVSFRLSCLSGDCWLIFKMRHEHAGWKSSGHGDPQIVVSLGVFFFMGWLVSRGNFPAWYV